MIKKRIKFFNYNDDEGFNGTNILGKISGILQYPTNIRNTIKITSV